MARAIPAEDYRLIASVAALAAQGRNQSDIATDLEKPLTSLRNTLEKHGLEMVPVIQVRAKIGGKTLDELLEDGDLVIAADGAEDRVFAGASR